MVWVLIKHYLQVFLTGNKLVRLYCLCVSEAEGMLPTCSATVFLLNAYFSEI